MSSEDIEKKGLGAEESNRMYESKGAAGRLKIEKQIIQRMQVLQKIRVLRRRQIIRQEQIIRRKRIKRRETGEIARKAQEIKDRAMQIQKMKAVEMSLHFWQSVISAVLQAFVIQAFIRPAELLSGGFTGIAILVEMLTSTWGISFPTSLGMLCINIPVAIICSRGISVRFTAFSLFQVFLTSGFLQFLHFEPLFDDPVLNVIFGGF